MTGTTKASSRPGATKAPPEKKPAAKNAASMSRADSLAKARAAKAAKAKAASGPVEEPALDTVAELTAADLAPVAEPAVKSPAAKPKPVVAPVETKEIAPPAVEMTVEPAAEVEQKGTEIMSDVIETTKKYTEEAKERFQTAFAEMSEKAKTGVEKSTKALEEFSDIAKGNVEALVESGKIATKGIESIGQDAAEYGRVTFEKASAAMKNLAAVKSPTEFFQLQSELLSSSFDAFAKETAKNSEAFLKLAGDVVQPISTRVSIVTEKVRSLAA